MLVNSQPSYLSGLDTIDTDVTTFINNNDNTIHTHNTIEHKIQHYSDVITNDEIIATMKQYYVFCDWLQQHDDKQIVAIEYQ